MTLITCQGRAVAIADVDRFHLAPHVDRLPDGHPLKTFVCFLALYTRDVYTGDVPVIPGTTSPPTASGTPARR